MNYYEKRYVIHEILKGCKNRDFSALGKGNANSRGYNVRCIFDFERVLKIIRWYVHKQNLYRGVATLKEIPQFTFNPKKRSEETSVWYRNEYDENITKYDLFFDFDKGKSDSWKSLLEDIKSLKDYLDEYRVPYSLIFSGNKGFQIVISGDYLDIEKIEKGNVYPHKTIVEKVKEMLDLKFLDLANNGVNSRLCKIPYSLVGDNIALPLSDKQFETFSIEDMKLATVMKEISILKRGDLERFSDSELEVKRGHVENFIKLFSFK